MGQPPRQNLLDLLLKAIRDARRRSTVRRLFFGWLGICALAIGGEITVRILVRISIAYVGFVALYLLSIIAPEVLTSRSRLLNLLLSLLDWIGRTLVYRWTRSLFAFLLLLVLIATDPSIRNLFVAGLIALLLLPERAPEEEHWHVSSNCETLEGHLAECTIDGHETTFWSSAENQRQGMWLDLYFGRPRYVDRLSIYYGKYLLHSPRAYELFAIRDSDNLEPLKTRCEETKSPAGHRAHRLRFQYVHATGLRLAILNPREDVKWSVAELVPRFNWRNRHDLFVAFAGMLAILGFLAYHFYGGPAILNRDQLTFGRLVHGSPDFSPDGRTVVYDTDEPKEGYNRLRLKDLISGTETDLSVLGDGKHWHATFCSENQILVFSSTLVDPRRPLDSHLFRLNIATDELSQLTFGKDRRYDWPHCSPGGTQLVYTALDGEGRHQLFLADPIRGEEAFVEQLTMFDGDAIHPRFSPDGNQIVFAGRQRADPAWALYMLSRTDRGWSVPTKILSLSSDAFHPDFSPDGNHIIFTLREAGAYTLCILELDTGSIGWIGYLWDTDGTFSSDGRIIAFSSARSGNWQVYLMPSPARYAPQFPTDFIVKRFHLLLVEFALRLQATSMFRPDPLMGY